MNGEFVNLRVSVELLEQWTTRDNDCNRLTMELGEPDEDGFYLPTITMDTTDNPLNDLRAKLDEPRADFSGDGGLAHWTRQQQDRLEAAERVCEWAGTVLERYRDELVGVSAQGLRDAFAAWEAVKEGT